MPFVKRIQDFHNHNSLADRLLQRHEKWYLGPNMGDASVRWMENCVLAKTERLELSTLSITRNTEKYLDLRLVSQTCLTMNFKPKDQCDN